MLSRLVDIKRSEWSRVLWVASVALAYAAVTSLGDDLVRTLFVTTEGAYALPNAFIFKAVIDVLAAAAYAPLARGRNPASAWRVALIIYTSVVLSAGLLVHADANTTWTSYAIFLAHECAWTVLTIHWGVVILGIFDASQAKRLFPVLFTAASVGRMLAGSLLIALSDLLSLPAMFVVQASLGVVAVVISLRLTTENTHDHAAPAPLVDKPDAAEAREHGWLAALRSPLVRMIAVSTGLMVTIRLALSIAAMDQFSTAMAGDRGAIQELLGYYGTVANGVGIVLGLVVVPRLFSRIGVGRANLAYASITVVGTSLLAIVPSIASAYFARFTRLELKHAFKTPLSALFYGAEPPPNRPLARAVVFGVAIPVATVVASALFWWFTEIGRPHYVLYAGIVAAICFVPVCAVQNRRFHRRQLELLRWRLARHPTKSASLDEIFAELRANHPHVNDGTIRELAQGLHSTDDRTVALSRELVTTLGAKSSNE